MMRHLFIVLALLLPAVASAEERKLTAAEIDEALSGNTVEGLWGTTPYKSWFGPDGLTIYKPEGGAPDRGRWRADADKHQYCSWWERSDWSCYDIYRDGDGDTIIWGIPGSDTRYPSTLLEGDHLN